LPEHVTDDNRKFKNLCIYYVHKDNALLGKYFRHGSEHFFSYGEEEFRIEKQAGEKRRFYIIDSKSEQVQGSLNIPKNYNFSYYPDVPYPEGFLQLILGENKYEFRREKPEKGYWLFDKTTWGLYRFGLYDKDNACTLVYDFGIDNALLDTTIRYDNTLSGNIETHEENYLLLFAGFYLLEYFFDVMIRAGG